MAGGGAVVGLDIGTTTIKAVAVGGGRQKPQLLAVGIAPTPEGLIANDVIVDPQALGQAVKQLLLENGISGRALVSSVAGQSAVVVRVIEIPRPGQGELEQMVKWEVERQVPFAAETTVMDYKVIERDMPEAEASENIEVFFAIAQQDLIDSHVETVMGAGLEPKVIDVEPLAICRSLLDIVRNGGEETVAIVNMGDKATEIDIFNRKLISFSRLLPLGGNALTRAISDMLGQPLEHAERLKKEMGEVFLELAETAQTGAFGGPMDFSQPQPTATFDAPAAPSPFDFTPPDETPQPSAYRSTTDGPVFDIEDDELSPPAGRQPLDLSADVDLPPPAGRQPIDLSGATGLIPAGPSVPAPASPSLESDEGRMKRQIFDAMLPILGDLVTELRRSLDYYRSRSREGVVHRLVLCGGMARMKNLAPFLERELGMTVEVANPLQHLEVGVKNLSREYLNEIAPLLPVAVGLAIRDMIAESARPKARPAKKKAGAAS
ncbi:MAG: type IV pilus assembly protein PilM [Armatimonadetes bacterium]|nr:type IV pilus assembly protein PilM [Armatimonadota bacterium]